MHTSCPTTTPRRQYCGAPRGVIFDLLRNFAIPTPAVKASAARNLNAGMSVRNAKQGLGANDNDTRRVFRRLDSVHHRMSKRVRHTRVDAGKTFQMA